ncbi:MAG: ABC transporter substrate-binding protein [Gaiellaceae bacterium]
MRRALWFGRAAGGLVVATAVLSAAAPGATERDAKEGGTFRVVALSANFDAIDPALYNLVGSAQILRPACAGLMGFPNKKLPAGLRLSPELAEDDPVISRNGKTYTFTIRRDARFSTGARVLARDVVHSLERVFTPRMQSPFAQEPLASIVGARAMLDGKATKLSGAVARGRTLILRLRKHVGDFPGHASVCVVPANVPVDPEGAQAPLPSAAPYYVAQYTPGERLVLARNRFYRGARPQHVSEIVANLESDAGAMVDRVETGNADFFLGSAALASFASDLTQRYGINRSQFFSVPGNFLRMFVLNTSRPLFKNNVELRRAVNFAVDRKDLTREFGVAAATPTDQYQPPIFPGFRPERIYPLGGPDLREARRLAAGHTRGGKAVLYTCDSPVCVAQAQILQRDLKAIGLDLEVATFPGTLAFEKMATEPGLFDIGRVGFALADPGAFAGSFDGRSIGEPSNQNWSYFDSPRFNRLIEAAGRLRFGAIRNRAYGELDVLLSRDAAPAIPYAVSNALTFVSARTGCIVLNPSLDLTAVCLK